MHIQHLPVLLQIANTEILNPLLSPSSGVLGAIIAILFVALYIMFRALEKKDILHKQERAEWRRDTLMQYEKYNDTTKEVVDDFKEALKQNNEAMKQNAHDSRQDRDKFNDTINKYSELLGTLKAKLEK